jgi:hypothetical protein
MSPDILNREPILRKIEDRIDDKAHRFRNNTFSKPIEERVPEIPKRNFGGGIGAGFVEAGIAVVLEDVIGVPFGADTDVVGIEKTEEGMHYTVNVNAPLENMAKARAFIDSGTGFTGILTDVYDVRDVEVLKTRPLRDTYQVELMIKD